VAGLIPRLRETGWRVISDEDGPRDTKDDKINVPNYDLALITCKYQGVVIVDFKRR